MKVLVALEERFAVASNDSVVVSKVFGYNFWADYLGVFDEVVIVGRLYRTTRPLGLPVEGPGVTFFPVLGNEEPAGYVRTYYAQKRQIREACERAPAAILRLPGVIGGMVCNELRRSSRPYAVRVVGDPWDSFSPGAFPHRASRLLRWWFRRELERQCLGASVASYATKHSLQARYPAAPGVSSVFFSDVRLSAEVFLPRARVITQPRPSFTLLNVGTMAMLYKGQDVLIDAVAMLVGLGHDVRLNLVGDGRFRRKLEEQATQRAISNRIAFHGELPAGDAVRTCMDQADLFVFPSRAEGLPRAMIEAMARGLPCIATPVGGIPELLPPEDLVPPNDPVSLTGKIVEVMGDPDRLTRMSARNLDRAREYALEEMRPRLIAFLALCRECTERWGN